MSFIVSEECVALGLRAGAVIFREVSIGPAPTELRAEIAAEVAALQARFPDPRAIWQLPEVVSYEEILRKVGAHPGRAQPGGGAGGAPLRRPSVGRLLTFALKRGDLPAINSLVDAYNLASVRTLCSLGAHDLDRISPPVSLRLLTGAEPFTPLGSETPEPVVAGEFGYVDAAGRVLCRLDVLQAEFSKVTPATRNALLIVEGTTAHRTEMVRQAFEEAVSRIRRYCGGTVEVVAMPGD